VINSQSIEIGCAKLGIEKRLVLDANILLRAVFGIRVRSLLEAYESTVAFYTPDVCFDDARKYGRCGRLLVCTSRTKNFARTRISSREANDWPIVATSLLLDCPIWTEDQDFFGSGARGASSSYRSLNRSLCYRKSTLTSKAPMRLSHARKSPESYRRRHFHDCGWQSEMKRRASSVVGCGPQTATVRFHD